MNTPRIVYCTTCKGRAEHLKLTLPQNMWNNGTYQNAKFVVLDYGSDDDLIEFLNAKHARAIASGTLAVYSVVNPGPWHIAHAKNMAARCGILEGADILVTLDADNYTGPEFSRYIATKFAEPGILPGIFLCPDFLHIRSLPHGPDRPCRGFAGRLAIWAKDFIKMGGYDEVFSTWQGEDMDLLARMERLGYQRRFIDKKYLNAIPHNADVRFKEYPEARKYETKEEEKRINARTETVVNYGNFGVGKVIKRLYLAEGYATLDPIPTRIFGIGMHKTGTTSLDRAFKILGLDSFHWGAGESPLIWQEMQALGRSLTAERWYAFSDLPFPLLYKQLDKSYPGSKFILTLRDENAWLKSVEKLWSYDYNPTRWMWDVYPFSNHIHSVLYGTKDFDATVFLNRYRRHNAEVLEYFKDRPGDLLVMHMDGGGDWNGLCQFLKHPVPNQPYPHRNPSTGLETCGSSL